MQAIVERIRARLEPPCLARRLAVREDPATALRTVTCSVREVLPAGVQCDASVGRSPVLDRDGHPTLVRDNAGEHAVCEIEQVPTVRMNGVVVPVVDGTHRAGWYYFEDAASAVCRQRVRFTPGAEPVTGSVTRLECIQTVTLPAAPRPTN